MRSSQIRATVPAPAAPARDAPGQSATSIEASDGQPGQEGTDTALIELGHELQRLGYHFTTITPDSHRRVNARPGNEVASDLPGIFGWSRHFRAESLSPILLRLMCEGGVLVPTGALLRSAVRFSTMGDLMIMHSAFPTDQHDSVFLGPDTQRFIRTLAEAHDHPGSGHAGSEKVGSLIEIGGGSGAAILSQHGRARHLIMTDINPLALRYARINAAIAGIRVDFRLGDLFAGEDGPFDLIIANPPYLVDPQQRWYRDGGGEEGTALALRIVGESLARLSPTGRLILYTGVPISAGIDHFRTRIDGMLGGSGIPYRYDEIEVDVFGEELSQPYYAEINADRLAVIVLRVGPSQGEEAGHRRHPRTT